MFATLKSAALRQEASAEQQAVKWYLYLHARHGAAHERKAAADQLKVPGLTKQWLEEDLSRILRTASPSASTTSLSATSTFSQILTRFLGANAPLGAFDSMKGDMQEVPLRSRIVLNSNALAGGEIAEGRGKPIRRLTLAELDTEAAKFASDVVMSRELLLEAPDLAVRLLASALTEAVQKASDAFFLSKLAAQEIGESSGEVNPSWSLALSDIEELLREVQTGEASRLWLILTPRACKYLSRLATENGVTTLGWAGGTLMGINVIARSQQTANRLTLVDASGVVYADGGVEVRSSD